MFQSFIVHFEDNNGNMCICSHLLTTDITYMHNKHAKHIIIKRIIIKCKCNAILVGEKYFQTRLTAPRKMTQTQTGVVEQEKQNNNSYVQQPEGFICPHGTGEEIGQTFSLV